MELRKTAVIAVFLIFTVSLATAPEPQQSHPLSEIVPVDVDLNMSDQAIKNISEVQLNNGIGNTGLLLKGYAITHSGEAQKLVLDYSNDEWDVINSDINLNGNNISGFFDSNCQSSEAIADVNNDGSFECMNVTGEVSDAYVNRSGDSMSGDLDLQENNILNPREVDGINLSNPGNAISVSGNQYAIGSGAITNTELANSAVTVAGNAVSLGSSTAINHGDLSSITYNDHHGVGNAITWDGSNNVAVASSSIGSNELDETDSYSLGWSNLAIAQSDVAVSDLGAADAALDMNGNLIDHPSQIRDSSGNTMINFDHSNRDVEINDNTGFQLPVGTDAY